MVGRPKEGNFKQMSLNLDPGETDTFTKNLPRNKSLSEVIRQYIHDENVRIDREKKVIGAVDNSPIKTRNSVNNKKQDILDKYFGNTFMDYENYELRQEVFNKLTDEQRHNVAIAVNKTAEAWRSMMITEQHKRRKTK